MWAIVLLLTLLSSLAAAQDRTTSPNPEANSPSIAAARKALQNGHPDQAVTMLQQLASGAPPQPGAARELGLAYYRTGKLIPAEQAFAQAMQQDPQDIEAIQLRGLTLYRLGRPAAAIPYLEKVRQWTPDANADANYVLGLCYLNSQRYDDARGAFAAQYGVPADSGPAYLLLGNMLMHAHLPELAATAASKALTLSPNLPLAHLMLGEVALFKSDPKLALEEFDRERQINPSYPGIYDRLGDAYIRVGDYQHAQEALSKAISLDTSSTGPFILMGKVLLRKQDPQTAALYLEHAAKMDPGNYITHTLLAQSYRAVGRDAEAKEEIDRASKIHADNELKLEPVQ
jgi:tetratricopeptide (TPR) repeat protein